MNIRPITRKFFLMTLPFLMASLGLWGWIHSVKAGTTSINLEASDMAKISYRLWMLFDIQQNAPEINEAEVARQLSLPPDGPGSLYKNEKGDYLVYIRLAEITPEALASLAATGVKIEDIAEAYRTITAWLKLDQLPALAALSTVENVEEELRPFTSQIPSLFSASEETPTDCNSIISEGDSHLRADEARAAFNLDGTGVTIGILSDSFDQDTNAVTHASDDILSGDLPGPGNPCGHLTAVEVITTGLHGGHDEGRGMLQLVHDLAPGATLKFASGNGIYEFGTNIENLRAAGADILADDVAYANEPWFQAGPNGVAISNVVGSGAFYFTAAGNSNLLLPNGNEAGSYEAPAYRPIACPANLPAVETSCHNFYPGPGSVDDPSDTITLISGGSFVAALQWAQPWYGITTDLDFFLLDANGNVVASAVHTNAGVNGSQKPFELIFYTNNTGSTQTYDLVVARANVGDALSPRIKFIFLVSNGGITDVEYHVSNLGDIIGPTIFGHSGAEDAFSVAAMAYDQYANVEHYSSRGPVTYYFAPATDTNPALPLAIPHVINKPDFTATDGGRTTFFGSNYGGGVYRFFGTSAAAPHAAAVAALVQQRWGGSLSQTEMRTILETTARPITYSNVLAAGAGLLDAYAATASIAQTAPTIVSPLDATGFVAQPFNYPVTVVGTLPISISTSELPDNLTLSSGVITGIPVIPGTFDITLTATNSIGQDVEHLSLTILDISTFLNVYLPIIQH